MNIVITSASRKVSLVQAFKKALNREGGGNVITADMNEHSPAAQFSSANYVICPDEHPDYIPLLLKICERENIKLIVPSRDGEMRILAENKKQFDKIGVRVVVPSIETINVCSDKLAFVAFCKANGFKVPKTDAFLREFPLFINNRFGQASKDAHRVNSIEELNAYCTLIEYPILQEYIALKEYTIDLCSDFDSRVISVVPRERVRTFAGESFVGKTVKSRAMINQAIKLAEKLQLVGHNTIQCFFNDRTKEATFFEINLRYGGGATLGIKAGADTPRYLIQLAKGQEVKSRINKYKKGVTMYRYSADKFKYEK